MRLGILSAGDMGSAHAAYYAQMPDVEVAAIVGWRPAIPDKDPYWTECRCFVDCVAGRDDLARIDATVAREALRVALAAEESWQCGGERVSLP